MTNKERFIEFMGLSFKDTEFTKWLESEGFFEAPASTKYHGSYPGGLFEHSLSVAQTLVDFTKGLKLSWFDARSPKIVGMFHDVCKIGNYVSILDDNNSISYTHNAETMFAGHGDKSVIMLASHMKLTEEEVFCIRYHMGAYERNDWDYYDRAIKKYPNVLYTHTADMVASKVWNL